MGGSVGVCVLERAAEGLVVRDAGDQEGSEVDAGRWVTSTGTSRGGIGQFTEELSARPPKVGPLAGGDWSATAPGMKMVRYAAGT